MYQEGIKADNKSIYFELKDNLEILSLKTLQLEQTALGSQNSSSKTILIAILLGSIVVGTYFKSALYFHLYETRKESAEKSPINLLILVQAITQHLIYFLLVAFYVIGLLFDDVTYAERFGRLWFLVPQYAQFFSVAYRSISSCAIAIFRLLLITCNLWIKDVIGLKNMRAVCLAFGIILSLVLSIGFGMGNGREGRNTVIMNFCTGQSVALREVHHKYAMITGEATIESEKIGIWFSAISYRICIASVFVELLCYICFFKQIYTHDQHMLTTDLLPVEEIRKRHRKNAFTFLGQFYGFVSECLLYFGMILSIKQIWHINIRMWLAMGLSIEFGILSVVEIMTSDSLVQYLPHNFVFPRN